MEDKHFPHPQKARNWTTHPRTSLTTFQLFWNNNLCSKAPALKSVAVHACPQLNENHRKLRKATQGLWGKQEMSVISLTRKELANKRDMSSTHCSFLHVSSCPLQLGYKTELRQPKHACKCSVVYWSCGTAIPLTPEEHIWVLCPWVLHTPTSK